MTCGAVILAAGASRRLGAPKQLLEYQGRSLVADAAAKARDVGCDPIIVVTGAYADRVESALAAIPGLTIARNDDWESGQGTSVAIGVRTLRSIDPASSAILFLLCDQPLIPIAHLRTLVESAADGDTDIAATQHADGAGGVPACFRSTCFGDLAQLEGTDGARAVIASSNWTTRCFESPLASFDVDSPEDAARLAGNDGADHSRGSATGVSRV